MEIYKLAVSNESITRISSDIKEQQEKKYNLSKENSVSVPATVVAEAICPFKNPATASL